MSTSALRRSPGGRRRSGATRREPQPVRHRAHPRFGDCLAAATPGRAAGCDQTAEEARLRALRSPAPLPSRRSAPHGDAGGSRSSPPHREDAVRRGHRGPPSRSAPARTEPSPGGRRLRSSRQRRSSGHGPRSWSSAPMIESCDTSDVRRLVRSIHEARVGRAAALMMRRLTYSGTVNPSSAACWRRAT